MDSELDFEDDPVLLVGVRKQSGKIAAFRVETHEDTFPALRTPCELAWSEYAQAAKYEFQPYGALEPGEAYVIETEDLPKKREGRRPTKNPDSRPLVEAALLSVISEADSHEVLSAATLASTDFNFYAICYRDEHDALIGFVRQASPQRTLKAGFKYFAYNDTLRSVQTPALAIDTAIDLIVGPDELGILRASAAKGLLTDVRLAFEEVPEHLAALKKKLVGLKISDESLAALETVSRRSVRAARRLQEWADGPGANAQDVNLVTQAFADRGLGGLFHNGGMTFGEGEVNDFLDCLVGRLYGDALSGEERRADRYSRR